MILKVNRFCFELVNGVTAVSHFSQEWKFQLPGVLGLAMEKFTMVSFAMGFPHAKTSGNNAIHLKEQQQTCV